MTALDHETDSDPAGRGGLATVRLVAGHELRLMRRNIEATVALLVMPLVVLIIFTPLLSPLVRERDLGETGAVLSVPGLLVTFGFVAVGFVAGSVFREHGWGTWTRLRTVGAPGWSVIVGKVAPHTLLLLAQAAVLLTVGGVFFDLPVLDAPLALFVLTVVWAFCLVGLAATLVSVARDVQQVYLFINVGSLVLSGLGGALVPLELFPAPLRAVARVLPTYWSVRAYRDLLGGDAGLGTITLPVVVLLGMTVAFFAIAVWRFRFDDEKKT